VTEDHVVSKVSKVKRVQKVCRDSREIWDQKAAVVHVVTKEREVQKAT